MLLTITNQDLAILFLAPVAVYIIGYLTVLVLGHAIATTVYLKDNWSDIAWHRVPGRIFGAYGYTLLLLVIGAIAAGIALLLFRALS